MEGLVTIEGSAATKMATLDLEGGGRAHPPGVVEGVREEAILQLRIVFLRRGNNVVNRIRGEARPVSAVHDALVVLAGRRVRRGPQWSRRVAGPLETHRTRRNLVQIRIEYDRPTRNRTGLRLLSDLQTAWNRSVS